MTYFFLFFFIGVEVIYEILDPSLPEMGGQLKLNFGDKGFEDKPFVNVAKEGLEMPSDEEHKKRFETEKAEYYQLCKIMKETLNEKIEEVRYFFNCSYFRICGGYFPYSNLFRIHCDDVKMAFMYNY